METTTDVAAPARLVTCPHCQKSRNQSDCKRVAEWAYDYRAGQPVKKTFLVCADTCARGYEINLAIYELKQKQRVARRRTC